MVLHHPGSVGEEDSFSRFIRQQGYEIEHLARRLFPDGEQAHFQKADGAEAVNMEPLLSLGRPLFGLSMSANGIAREKVAERIVVIG